MSQGWGVIKVIKSVTHYLNGSLDLYGLNSFFADVVAISCVCAIFRMSNSKGNYFSLLVTFRTSASLSKAPFTSSKKHL